MGSRHVQVKQDYCVTFDLWETLFIDRHELDRDRDRMRYEGLHQVLSGLDIEVPLDSLRGAYEESARQLQGLWRRNESISVADQIRLIVREAAGDGLDLIENSQAIEMLQNAYVEPLFEFPPKLNVEAIATLKGMRERVGRVGLISNTGRSPGAALRRLMDKYEILHFFDATIFSDEVGCRKPEKQIFQTAIAQLGSSPDRTIHIGDDPEADIWGAKQFGMRALLFDYQVPEEFQREPTSLFALSRGDRRVPDSEIQPDARIASLKEALAFIDSLS